MGESIAYRNPEQFQTFAEMLELFLMTVTAKDLHAQNKVSGSSVDIASIGIHIPAIRKLVRRLRKQFGGAVPEMNDALFPTLEETTKQMPSVLFWFVEPLPPSVKAECLRISANVNVQPHLMSITTGVEDSLPVVQVKDSGSVLHSFAVSDSRFRHAENKDHTLTQLSFMLPFFPELASHFGEASIDSFSAVVVIGSDRQYDASQEFSGQVFEFSEAPAHQRINQSQAPSISDRHIVGLDPYTGKFFYFSK